MIKSTTKYTTLLFLLLVICTQCRTSRTKQLQREYKSIYIDQFKLTYFRKLLQVGFNNSEAVNSIIKSDRSGFTESVLTDDDYRLIDSIVHLNNLRMTTDSVSRIGQVAEGAEGKHVLSYILNKLESKWLDSLAKHRYKSSGIRSMYNE